MDHAALRTPEPAGRRTRVVPPDEPPGMVHRRRYARRDAQVPVVLRLLGADGDPIAEGTGILTDLTPVGAFCTDLRLAPAGLPLGPFRVSVRASGEGPALEALCRPVRATFGARPGLGLAFEQLRVEV